jgi:hypothetical protein
MQGSYFPQQPPQKQQQNGQHAASPVKAAQRRQVEQHVTCSALNSLFSLTGKTRLLTIMFAIGGS